MENYIYHIIYIIMYQIRYLVINMTQDNHRLNPILHSLHLNKKEFVTSDEIRSIGKRLGVNPQNSIRNLAARGYIVRIFRGLFYVKDFEDVMMGRSKYSHLEIVAKGLEQMNVKAWYFCLHTALKLNNQTHETLNMDYIASDTLFRGKVINIVGHMFKFHKLGPSLFDFGIRTDIKPLRFSDAEKTILDIIYINRYNAVPEKRIALDIGDLVDHADRKRIDKYLEHYPKTVGRTIEGLK